MPRALLSVSDKRGLAEFARSLHERGWTLLSTGGTARSLRDAGIPVTSVTAVTGHPEIMGGRVKTLHPAVHAGLLARPGHAGDAEEMGRLGYEHIDLLAVNLYPFRETVARPGVTLAEAVENIDIGGPAMLRAAAKNHERLWVVVDPDDYSAVLASLDGDEAEGRRLRRRLAAKGFAHTSSYDAAITDYLAAQDDGRSAAGGEEGRGAPAGEKAEERFPARIHLSLRKLQDLRYGENPDQRAAFYAEGDAETGIAAARQLHGKELSFNNLLDVEGAVLAVSAWKARDTAACAIIKHTTPCGLGIGPDPAEAYAKALSTDPKSAFGSVVAFNCRVSEQAAILLRPNYVEAVVATGFAPRALEILSEKKNLRLLELPETAWGAGGMDFKRVRGGFLAQDRLATEYPEEGWTVVTEREPTAEEWHDLRFAWRAVASVKSNAILLASGGRTVGIGAGQMSRVDSSRVAVMKAEENGFDLSGAALASDAFFPFRDGVDAAADAGVRAIIQPGGSVRDEEVIAAANEHGVAMVFTARRLFRH